jgi:hypothetical protein
MVPKNNVAACLLAEKCPETENPSQSVLEPAAAEPREYVGKVLSGERGGGKKERQHSVRVIGRRVPRPRLLVLLGVLLGGLLLEGSGFGSRQLAFSHGFCFCFFFFFCFLLSAAPFSQLINWGFRRKQPAFSN